MAIRRGGTLALPKGERGKPVHSLFPACSVVGFLSHPEEIRAYTRMKRYTN